MISTRLPCSSASHNHPKRKKKFHYSHQSRQSRARLVLWLNPEAGIKRGFAATDNFEMRKKKNLIHSPFLRLPIKFHHFSLAECEATMKSAALRTARENFSTTAKNIVVAPSVRIKFFLSLSAKLVYERRAQNCC